MKHTLVALLRDQPGVLNRSVSLFRRRGFNIESLTVGHTETPGISRMTLVVDGDTTSVEQVIKQLYKLIDVLKVSDVSQDPNVTRDLLLVKVYAPPAKRSELMQLADIFGAKIVDVVPDAMMIELSGSPEQLDRFVDLIRPFGIRELVRTGCVAMTRGASTVSGPYQNQEFRAA
ncbi:acetolactate synthase, small subunit [Herpetosiphon aurantiacus DSM 785]|uniref:Acetolactate synthase small subunit n=3 Tax=Herpetosiphonaceae TaxID=189773 RepID=A9AZM6_HERA2|nr:acetolactate synthase small subunit [Herpetosiphon sp.]ABX07080.1 acetolactate synthase, small subunit [Herpetosiphon aurantiacus DSM 785]